MTPPSPWKSEIIRLLVLWFPLLFSGWVLDLVPHAVVLGLLLYLGWNLYHLVRLERWLRRGAKRHPPEASGIWGEIFRYYYLIKQKEKRRKKRVAELLKQFRATNRAMPDAALILDQHYEIEWINEASTALLGFHPKRDIGQRVDNFLRTPEFIDYLERGDFSDAITIPSPLSMETTLSVRLVPFGKHQRLMVATDVTEMHRINTIRKDFVANTSHELRTPLTVLRGYLENMSDLTDGELQRWQHPLRKMCQQTDHMINIVDDMLLLSEIEQSRQAPLDQLIDIPELLRGVTDEARILSEQQNQGQRDFLLELDTELLLRGDQRDLYAACSNLIFNAVKYTPHDGTITITWERIGDTPRLTVTDTGIGIPKRDLARLTERFYRVDKGRSRDRGGTGLGLAIVHHVAHRHDAELRIDSQWGEGSQFSILFPGERGQ